jgi:hypothetical protein
MLKVTLAVLAVALAGTASAAGWRSMRIDGSSEAGFNASVMALRAKLPTVRRHVLDLALKDVLARGEQAAAAAQREYPRSEYLRQLDGLSYKEIVTFTDPSGETADRRFRQIYAELYGPAQSTVNPSPGRQEGYRAPGSLDGANQRGGVAQMEQNAAWQSR